MIVTDLNDRERRKFAEQFDKAAEDFTLCYDVWANHVEWATTEADHLLRILDRLQGADLPQGGGQ